MTLYDIIFLVLTLLAVLTGIALGFHISFRLAENRYEGKDRKVYHASSKSTQIRRDAGIEQERKTRKSKLRERVKRKDATSFAEFNCEFTGEDHAKKLERVMSEQDEAYNCLEQRVEKT